MKKSIILTSILLMFALLLTGCGEKVVGKKYEASDFGSEIENEKGFALKEQKFDYNGENVLLISAENELDSAKNLHLVVTYKDADGKQIKKDSKSIEGFAAGDSQYIVLRPEIEFAQHSYIIIVEDFEGVAEKTEEPLEFGEITFVKTMRYNDELAWEDDLTEFPTIRGKIDITNPTDITYSLKATIFVFDKNGELYNISTAGGTVPPKAWGGTVDFTVYQQLDGEFVWPEELNEDASYFIAYEVQDRAEVG